MVPNIVHTYFHTKYWNIVHISFHTKYWNSCAKRKPFPLFSFLHFFRPITEIFREKKWKIPADLYKTRTLMEINIYLPIADKIISILFINLSMFALSKQINETQDPFFVCKLVFERIFDYIRAVDESINNNLHEI
jgi:hypothetical protein